MKPSLIINIIIYIFLFASCTQKKAQETTSGKNIAQQLQELTNYLTEYTSRGAVNIDTISLGTLYYEYSEDYVMEYGTFKVKWSAETYSGRAEGKGIKLWKRQPDKSLKIFRHAGSHDYLE